MQAWQCAVSAALPRYALAHHFRTTSRSVMAGLRTNRFNLRRQDDTARDARLTLSEERLRAARQQEAVAHLGQQALAGAPVAELTDAAVALAARALEVEFASLLELRPESRTLLLRAGVGWRAGAVGRTILPADADSHAGYVLRSTGQVVVEDLTSERRVGRSHASPSVERVLGYGPSDLLERSAFDYVHPEDIALVAEALARAIQRPGSPQSAQFRFRAQDGSWRLLDAVGQARAERGGSAHLIVNARDVTERRRQERALRENKERLRTGIAGAPLGLFALDGHGVFTMVEGRGLDALGVRPALLVGRSAFELYADLPHALADVRRALAGATFSSAVEGFGVGFEPRYAPVRDGDGPVAGAVGVLWRRDRGCRGDVEAPERPGDSGAACGPRGPPRGRHHRMFRDDRGGRDRAAGAGRATAAIAEAGGDRPADRRDRARLQQPAHDHPPQRAAALQGAPHDAPARARRPARRHGSGPAPAPCG